MYDSSKYWLQNSVIPEHWRWKSNFLMKFNISILRICLNLCWKLYKMISMHPLWLFMHFTHSCNALDWYNTSAISTATHAMTLCATPSSQFCEFILSPNMLQCVMVLHNIPSIANSKQRDTPISTGIKTKRAEKSTSTCFTRVPLPHT